MKIKHILSITALLLIAVLAAASFTSCAKKDDPLPTLRTPDESEIFTFGTYTYIKNTDGTAIITAYSGSETSIVLPAMLDGCGVVGIGAGAFSENETITSLTLPADLETIDEYAFAYCTSLSRIDIPGKKLWRVGAAAFVGTPWLASMTDEFAVIGQGVLLKYQGRGGLVEIPSGVRYITDAFTMNESVTCVNIPDSVRYIGDSAFAYCTELRRVEFGSGLISIGNSAFEGCETLSAITLGDSLTTIGEYAFRDCYQLSYAGLGRSVEKISTGAFFGTQRLKVIYLPASLKCIENDAFADCFSLSLLLYESDDAAFEAIECATSNYILTEAERRCNYSGGIE